MEWFDLILDRSVIFYLNNNALYLKTNFEIKILFIHSFPVLYNFNMYSPGLQKKELS